MFLFKFNMLRHLSAVQLQYAKNSAYQIALDSAASAYFSRLSSLKGLLDFIFLLTLVSLEGLEKCRDWD